MRWPGASDAFGDTNRMIKRDHTSLLLGVDPGFWSEEETELFPDGPLGPNPESALISLGTIRADPELWPR